MKRIVAALVYVLLCYSAVAQITFYKTYGFGPSYSTPSGMPHCIREVDKGSYVVLGSTGYNQGKFSNLVFTKIDSIGRLIWKREYGGNAHEGALYQGQKQTNIEVANNGGYILCSSSNSFNSSNSTQILVIKTDEEGGVEWFRIYYKPIGGLDVDYIGVKVKPWKNNGFIVFGRTLLNNLYGSKPIVIRIDSVGNIIWDKIYESSNDYFGISDVAIDDSSYIYMTGNRQIAKLDSNGNIIWFRRFVLSDTSIVVQGGTQAKFNDIECLPSGNIIISGTSIFSDNPSSSDPDYYPFVMQLDPSGNINWAKEYNGIKGSIFDLISVGNGANLVAVGSDSWYNGNFILKTDSVGNAVWAHSFDSLDLYALSHCSIDNGFILGGYSGLNHIYKTDSLGLLNCNEMKYINDSDTIVIPPHDSSVSFGVYLTNTMLSSEKLATDSTPYREHYVCSSFNWGCTDSLALNYDPNADYMYGDDCVYPDSLSSVKRLIDQYCVMPNPSNGIFEINFGKDLDEKSVSYVIYDLTGSVVFLGDHENRRVDISNLSSGVYILALFDSKGFFREKIIVNNSF